MIILFILFFIGSAFGSFSTVIIERLYNKKSGILFGRSECPYCKEKLSALSLIPIFSYIIQNGKCRNCKKKISIFYLISEVVMGGIFLILGEFILSQGWGLLETRSIILFILGCITGIYILYDMRYMEVPDQIMIPGIYTYGLLLAFTLFYGENRLFFDREYYSEGIDVFILDHFLGAIIIYSFFYLQILIPATLYLIRKRRYKDILHLCISYLIFPILLIIEIYTRKRKDDTVEDIPTWIGGGDLRIALFIGITLGTIHSISAVFIAYMLGSIISTIILISKKKNILGTKIPFGPFLGSGWLISILFYEEIIEVLLLR